MTAASYFEDLHVTPDPFGYRTSWYEQRKRDLLLASLPRPRYQRAWELGCSNGVLSAALATRCASLLATDVSHRAVEQARAAVLHLPHVEVAQAHHPGTLPAGRFDLVVCSEMGYYLSSQQLPALRDGLHAALEPGGLLLACHWQRAFDEAGCSATEVHRELGTGLSEVFQYRDVDFILQGWSLQPYSVAAQEGLR